MCTPKVEADCSQRPCSADRDSSSVSARSTLVFTPSLSTLIESMSRIAVAYSCLYRSMSPASALTVSSAACLLPRSSSDWFFRCSTSSLRGAMRLSTLMYST